MELLKSQISKEELLILTSLLNKDNKKLSFTILIILNYIGLLEDGEKLFSLDEEICCNIASFLGNNKSDDIFLFYGVLLIRNLCLDKNTCDIFNKYNIIKFFEEIYEKHLLDNKFIEYIIFSICNIISFELKKPKQCNFSVFIPCIKIFATQLRPYYAPDILYKYIYKLYELCISKDMNIYYEIINCKIHKELMSIYPHISEQYEILNQKLQKIASSKQNMSKEELDQYQKDKRDMEYLHSICLIILKILGKLMYLEDGILTQTLLNANICKFLYPLIHSNDIRIVKNVCFCLSNISSGTYGQLAYLFNENILYELIKVSKNIYDAMQLSKEKNDYYCQLRDTFREITFVFTSTINNSNFENCVPFVKSNDYTVVMVLMKGLELFGNINDEDLILAMLSAIEKLNSINHYFEGNIIAIMEKFGLKENLERIMMNKNWENVGYVEMIYDALFGEI